MIADFLDDIRFTDLTWAGAGPFGTKVFADFGADIVKVESTVRLDSVRTGGPFKDREYGVDRSGYFASRNTGKKSFTVDMKSDAGLALLHDLIRHSDVISNNFGPGAMERLRLSYEEVRAINPDIVYLSMPMYGESGPLAKLLGVGMTISAVTGLMWATAYEEGDPVGPGTHYPDHAANPYHAAFAVLAALRYRKLTGRGMKIDLSQVESTLNFIGTAVTEHAMTGEEPPITGNADTAAAPHGIYRARGDDHWISIAVTDDTHWPALCAVMERADLADDPALETAEGRLAQSELLDRALADRCGERDADDAALRLREAGVPAARVASARYLIEDDPQLAARRYFQRVAHPELGESLYASLPFTIDGERIELARPPLLGEHTREILTSLLGRTEDEVDRLDAEGVLR
jgi:benzylsuccinate CoA-transferase BbsF subunit